MNRILEAQLSRLRIMGFLAEPPRHYSLQEGGEMAGDTTFLVVGQPHDYLSIVCTPGATGNLVARGSRATTTGSRIFMQGSFNTVIIGRDARLNNADIRTPES